MNVPAGFKPIPEWTLPRRLPRSQDIESMDQRQDGWCSDQDSRVDFVQFSPANDPAKGIFQAFRVPGKNSMAEAGRILVDGKPEVIEAKFEGDLEHCQSLSAQVDQAGKVTAQIELYAADRDEFLCYQASDETARCFMNKLNDVFEQDWAGTSPRLTRNFLGKLTQP